MLKHALKKEKKNDGGNAANFKRKCHEILRSRFSPQTSSAHHRHFASFACTCRSKILVPDINVMHSCSSPMPPCTRPCVSLFSHRLFRNDEKPWQSGQREGKLTNINTCAKSRAKNSGKIRIEPLLGK